MAVEQPNDPVRVAEAIVKAVDADHPPLRHVFGTEALDAVRDKLDRQRRQLDAREQVTASTAIAQPATPWVATRSRSSGSTSAANCSMKRA